MGKYEKLLEKLKNGQNNIRYEDLRTLCVHYFGEPYQVRQVLYAIEKKIGEV